MGYIAAKLTRRTWWMFIRDITNFNELINGCIPTNITGGSPCTFMKFRGFPAGFPFRFRETSDSEKEEPWNKHTFVIV